MQASTIDDPGRWAEHQVLLRLTARGWSCLAQRWRCRFGELDLVMAKRRGDAGRLLVVEVKARRRCGPDGWGLAACHGEKCRKLAKAWACWQSQHPWSERWSVEMVLALVPLPPNRCTVRWIPIEQMPQVGEP
ncbi:MAG: YraN family protein [Synechococcus sp.]